MTGRESAALGLSTVEEAVDAIRAGRAVIVVDDESRENEGDIIFAAEHATAQLVGWTVRHTSGVLCAAMPAADADRLELPPMVADNQDSRRTAYTVSVDARTGVSTGISGPDRARTLRLLADRSTSADDLNRPGHVFPLRALPGGVLERAGHTEASVDLCRLAGLPPVGVLAELVHDDGEMMRLPALLELGAEHGLATISIADLIAYRLGHAARPAPIDGSAAAHLRVATDVSTSTGRPASTAPPRVARRAITRIPTVNGTLRATGYRDLLTGAEHLALTAGDVTSPTAVVRVHSECLTGDVLGSLRCDCGPQLAAALAQVTVRGGAVIYLRGHEGRGVGLLAKLAAYALQDEGLDTVDANLALGLPVDSREYGAAAAILADLGIQAVRLLTNNPAKVADLLSHGVSVVERVPLLVPPAVDSRRYLDTKRDRMGHVLPGLLVHDDLPDVAALVGLSELAPVRSGA